jgi:hypothetical protein
MAERKVRIAWWGDSGPYGQWVRLEDGRTHGSGPFGPSEPHEIPEALWLAFDEADTARSEAEDAIDEYVNAETKAAAAEGTHE